MGNFKVKVNTPDESKEAQGLFFELGASWCYGKYINENLPDDRTIILHNFGSQLFWAHVYESKNYDDAKELTLPELRDMVQPSLNDQYAEIEQVRQESKDNVNHPGHYNKGGVECIDAIEASMTHEAFKGYLKGNVQKYMWRYEQKGGVESLRKAQWYLERLVASMDS